MLHLNPALSKAAVEKWHKRSGVLQRESISHSWLAPDIPTQGFYQSGRPEQFYFPALQIGLCCCRLRFLKLASRYSPSTPQAESE